MLGLFGLLGAVFAGAVIDGWATRNSDEDDEDEHRIDDDQNGDGNLLDDPDDTPDDPFRGLNPFRIGGTHPGLWSGAGNGNAEPDTGADPDTGSDDTGGDDTGEDPVEYYE